MRTNKYQIDCKGETCLWWWQPWLNSCLTCSLCAGRSPLGPCLTYQTCEQCPVAANEKKKMSREIFLSYPPVPKCGYFFSPHLFWPKFRTPEQELQMVGETGRRRIHVNCSSCCLHSRELLMPAGLRMPLPHHTCGKIFIFMHTYKQGSSIASIHKVQLKWWILHQVLLLNTKHFLQSSHSSITWSQWWTVVKSTVTKGQIVGKIVLVNA